MAVAGFVFTFVYDYIVHGIMLVPIYNDTPEIWRSPQMMEEYFPFYILFTVLIVSVLAKVFLYNYENKGVGEGIRFGAILGSLMGLYGASMVCYMPISWDLALLWFASSFFQLICLGLIFSTICQKLHK